MSRKYACERLVSSIASILVAHGSHSSHVVLARFVLACCCVLSLFYLPSYSLFSESNGETFIIVFTLPLSL
jgi:hypothetical protein